MPPNQAAAEVEEINDAEPGAQARERPQAQTAAEVNTI
jgi:hypothetical protein